MVAFGQIVILNGAPRSGKSSIVAAIQDTFDGIWMNLGVDIFARQVTPARYQPGIGLRPGGERPDLEPFLVASFDAMYGSISAHSRVGLNVVVDVGHHSSYSVPRFTLACCVKHLEGLPVLFVGVHCPLEVIMERRRASLEGHYLVGSSDEPKPEPIRRWQREVHKPGIYDLEVDTSLLRPEECATETQRCLDAAPRPTALERLAALTDDEDRK